MAKRSQTATRLEQLCAERGMRMTDQRRTIANVLAAADDHPNVEEVHKRAHALDNRISLSTVYRTVRLLKDAGILERREFGDGRARYERAEEEHHDHLIDIETGRVIEFHDDDIERLQEAIARRLGYELTGHKLELYGRPLHRRKSGAV
ncbi:MAG: Fur family transcriptional regulator [Hyphomicrobiales bacterium]|nr:Fur family transcriptional regulator [Hyphomicrobiales bacterium]